MNNRMIFLFGWLTFSLTSSHLSAQPVLPASPADTLYIVPLASDTLPAIAMKFETLTLIPFVAIPGLALFLGGHSYQINGRKVFSAAAVKPYFAATHDPYLAELYKKHKRNRAIWYSTTAVGSGVTYVGFMHLLVAIITLNSNAVHVVNPYLWWGGGLAAAGVAARVVSFRQLRKAVNYYNFKHVGRKPEVSLRLGLPQATPAGLGMYLRF